MGETVWPYVEIDATEESAEALSAALLDAGSSGVEQRGEGAAVRLVAYFREAPDLAAVAADLAATPGVDPETARAAAASLRAGVTPDDDWLRIWKRGFEPVAVGRRLLVFPSWKREEADRYADRVRIEVDPGMAFGTGTHETTRLCLEWLDSEWRGASLLDVGTGTGILAIAGALLAPDARVVAVDRDPVAVEVARENAARNGVAGRIRFDACGPEAVEGRFDAVVANLTADVIVSLAGHLAARCARAGRLVLSGILAGQADEVVATLEAAGFALAWRGAAGEWVALELRAP